MKNYLAIDTSTTRASVALAIGDAVYTAENEHLREHAQRLLPMIEQVLSQAEITLDQLHGIVLGRGPGSFTGLRIACSVVKGLAYGHDLPVYPVSSLAAIAEEVFYTQTASNTRVLTLLDARMHEVYWDCFDATGEHLDERVSPLAELNLPFDQPLIIAGVGFEEYLPELPSAIQHRCIQYKTVFPNAKAMIRIVRAGRCEPVSAGKALPIYVRNQVTQGASRG